MERLKKALSPCPICRYPTSRRTHNPYVDEVAPFRYAATCCNCGISTPEFSSQEAAAACWEIMARRLALRATWPSGLLTYAGDTAGDTQ